jgi:hypothetical protein
MLHHISKRTIPALILLSITACTSSQADETKETPDDTARLTHSEEAPPEVSTTLVNKGDFSRELVSNGKLEVQNKAEVAFEVQEQISDVRVREDELV